MDKRILTWDGCANVRDLGELSASDGRKTRFGAVIRGDTPSRLTSAGWSSLYNYGVRTIVSLHTKGMIEPELDVRSPYSEIEIAQVEIEDITDPDFLEKWARSGLWSTPLYYRDALERWPERHAAAVSAIARAKEGGVLFHCIRGNDRTGIIALLLLALAGVDPEAVLEDYLLSPDPERDEILKEANASVREAIFGALSGLDAEQYLLNGGASQADLTAVRIRLLG